MTPLTVAHGASVYFTSLVLLLMAITSLVAKHINAFKRFLPALIIVVASTYIFQLSTGLLSRAAFETQYRVEQLIRALIERGLSRPSSGLCIREQQSHFIYAYHKVTVPLAYGIPALVCIVSLALLILARPRIKTSKLAHTYVAMLTLYSLVMLGLALAYGFYGIENAIARYLYWYGAATYPIIFMYVYIIYGKNVKSILSTAALVLLICWITEPFYMPWLSLYSLFDVAQLSRFRAWNLFDYLYNSKLRPLLMSNNLAYCFTSFTSKHSRIIGDVVFNNGMFILFNPPN